MREKIGMRRSDIMLVNIAVWVNSEKNLRSNISMWANFYNRYKHQLPFVIWRDASVQHFNTPTGLQIMVPLSLPFSSVFVMVQATQQRPSMLSLPSLFRNYCSGSPCLHSLQQMQRTSSAKWLSARDCCWHQTTAVKALELLLPNQPLHGGATRFLGIYTETATGAKNSLSSL